MSQPPVPVVPGPPQQFPTSTMLPPGAIPPPPRPGPTPISLLLSIGGAVALVVSVIISGIAFAQPSGTAASYPSPSPVVVVSYIREPAPAAPPAPAPTTAPAQPPAATITDGVWTVGADIPAGKYRTTANVDDACYWEIDKSGTNGQSIVANDNPGGGRPTVTIKAGQDFTTHRCGTWQKIG